MATITIATALPYPYFILVNACLYMYVDINSDEFPGPPFVNRYEISKERKEPFNTRMQFAMITGLIYGILHICTVELHLLHP